MDTTTRTCTPLRQRMMEDMRMRKLEDKTQQAYIRAVRNLTVFLKRSPDTATVEGLRNFQLHLVDAGTSPITRNSTCPGSLWHTRCAFLAPGRLGGPPPGDWSNLESTTLCSHQRSRSAVPARKDCYRFHEPIKKAKKEPTAAFKASARETRWHWRM